MPKRKTSEDFHREFERDAAKAKQLLKEGKEIPETLAQTLLQNYQTLTNMNHVGFAQSLDEQTVQAMLKVSGFKGNPSSIGKQDALEMLKQPTTKTPSKLPLKEQNSSTINIEFYSLVNKAKATADHKISAEDGAKLLSLYTQLKQMNHLFFIKDIPEYVLESMIVAAGIKGDFSGEGKSGLIEILDNTPLQGKDDVDIAVAGDIEFGTVEN